METKIVSFDEIEVASYPLQVIRLVFRFVRKDLPPESFEGVVSVAESLCVGVNSLGGLVIEDLAEARLGSVPQIVEGGFDEGGIDLDLNHASPK